VAVNEHCNSKLINGTIQRRKNDVCTWFHRPERGLILTCFTVKKRERVKALNDDHNMVAVVVVWMDDE